MHKDYQFCVKQREWQIEKWEKLNPGKLDIIHISDNKYLIQVGRLSELIITLKKIKNESLLPQVTCYEYFETMDELYNFIENLEVIK